MADGDGWTAIDTGYNNDETKGYWRAAIERVCGNAPIARLIVTHFHPDHLGLAGWFEEEWGVRLWMTYAEWLQAGAFAGRPNPSKPPYGIMIPPPNVTGEPGGKREPYPRRFRHAQFRPILRAASLAVRAA